MNNPPQPPDITFRGARLEWDDQTPQIGAIYRYDATTGLLTQVDPVFPALPHTLPGAHLNLRHSAVIYVRK